MVSNIGKGFYSTRLVSILITKGLIFMVRGGNHYCWSCMLQSLIETSELLDDLSFQFCSLLKISNEDVLAESQDSLGNITQKPRALQMRHLILQRINFEPFSIFSYLTSSRPVFATCVCKVMVLSHFRLCLAMLIYGFFKFYILFQVYTTCQIQACFGR